MARIAAGTVLAAGIAWLSIGAAMRPGSRQPIATCSTWIDDSILAGKNRTETMAKYSEPIGDSIVARFPDSARVQVVTARHAPHGDPLSVGLLLNTTLARPGQWTLTMSGENARCTGLVYVGSPPPRSRKGTSRAPDLP
jgi:hypothetical protein